MAFKKTPKVTRVKINLPLARFGYCFLMDPKKAKEGEEDKKPVYEVTCIIDPTKQDLKPVYQAAVKALREIVPDVEITKGLHDIPMCEDYYLPFKAYKDTHKQVKDKNPEYKGRVIIPCRSHGQRPDIRRNDEVKSVIEYSQKDEVYSGMYGQVCVTPWYFDKAGNQGISFSLQSVLKREDGVPLFQSKSSAAEDFKDVKADYVAKSSDYDSEDDDDDDDEDAY